MSLRLKEIVGLLWSLNDVKQNYYSVKRVETGHSIKDEGEHEHELHHTIRNRFIKLE